MLQLTTPDGRKIYIVWDKISAIIPNEDNTTNVVMCYGEENYYRVVESVDVIIDKRNYFSIEIYER